MRKTKLLIIVLSVTLLGAACTPTSLGVSGDAGVWFSANHGETWKQKVLIYEDRTSRSTIADVDVHKLMVSSQDRRKWFALSRQSGLWFSWNGGNNWDLLLNATAVNDLAVDPRNQRVYYAAVGPSIAKTENEGDTFRAVYTSDQKTNEISSLALSPANPEWLYAGTNGGEILLSENAGVAWRQIGKLAGRAQKLAVHPNDADILYAGVAGRGLAQSVNRGKDWEYFTEAFKDFSGAGDFRDFALVPTGLVYASRFGLLRSLNQGKNWVALPLISGKQDSNIYALAVNQANPLELYYGTRSTFYRSLDGGFNWIPRQLPTTRAALSILLDPNNSDAIYMGVGRIR